MIFPVFSTVCFFRDKTTKNPNKIVPLNSYDRDQYSSFHRLNELALFRSIMEHNNYC